MSSKSNKGNPYNQYRMQLNTIEQGGYAKFEIKNEPTGEANKPTWISIVTITNVRPDLAKSIRIPTSCRGTGLTKSDAKDAACQKMLQVFAACNIFPKVES